MGEERTLPGGAPSAAAFAFAAVLIFMAGLAIKWGASDLYAKEGRYLLSKWVQDAGATQDDPWRVARAHLESALALDPGNPSLMEDVGRALDWRANRRPVPGPKEQAALLTESLTAFRQAAARRPVSPYSWSNLLLVKARLGQVDQEFARALALAARFGPWEREVQLAVVDAGLAAWDRLGVDLRQVVAENVSRASRHYRKELEQIVIIGRRQVIVCMTPALTQALKFRGCI